MRIRSRTRGSLMREKDTKEEEDVRYIVSIARRTRGALIEGTTGGRPSTRDRTASKKARIAYYLLINRPWT